MESTPGRSPRLSDHAQAGLSLALAAGSFWAFVVFVGPLLMHAPSWVETVGPPAVIALVLGSWIGGGAWFARVVGRRLGRGGWRGPVAAGVAAPLLTIAAVAAALQVEHLAVTEGRVAAALLPYAFIAAFAPYAAGLVLVLTLAAGLAAGSRRTSRSALAAAALTAALFVALSLLLDQLPGWRVGAGDRAMVKVALVANTLAAAGGGAAALALLARGVRSMT
jgi:hypothetical protein